MMDEKVMKGRSSPLHRKCKFCKWLTYHSVLGISGYYKCMVKDKTISDCLPDLTVIPRPFCNLFELDTEKRI